MTWHLKDRELEKKLIAINPDFVKTLTDTVEENLNQPNGWFDDKSLTEVELTYNGEFFGTAFFYTHELEEVQEYDPHAWNEYPKVTPPEGVLMRIECYDGTCGAGAFVNGEWHEDGTDELPNVIRFRSWNED